MTGWRKAGDGPRHRLRTGAVMRWLLLLAVGVLLLAPREAGAVRPDEMLDDPALEARAREISRNLRCLVCRNENIDDSNADLARDLRILVRERLKAGDSDEQVVQYIVDRYGEYVLLKPPVNGATLWLWIAGPVLLVIGLAIAFLHVRRRASAPEPATPLDPEEEARLARLLGEEGGQEG